MSIITRGPTVDGGVDQKELEPQKKKEEPVTLTPPPTIDLGPVASRLINTEQSTKPEQPKRLPTEAEVIQKGIESGAIEKGGSAETSRNKPKSSGEEITLTDTNVLIPSKETEKQKTEAQKTVETTRQEKPTTPGELKKVNIPKTVEKTLTEEQKKQIKKQVTTEPEPPSLEEMMNPAGPGLNSNNLENFLSGLTIEGKPELPETRRKFGPPGASSIATQGERITGEAVSPGLTSENFWTDVGKGALGFLSNLLPGVKAHAAPEDIEPQTLPGPIPVKVAFELYKDGEINLQSAQTKLNQIYSKSEKGEFMLKSLGDYIRGAVLSSIERPTWDHLNEISKVAVNSDFKMTDYLITEKASNAMRFLNRNFQTVIIEGTEYNLVPQEITQKEMKNLDANSLVKKLRNTKVNKVKGQLFDQLTEAVTQSEGAKIAGTVSGVTLSDKAGRTELENLLNEKGLKDSKTYLKEQLGLELKPKEGD